MSKRTLFVLANSVWRADDFLHSGNTNPLRTDHYLFATREEAEKKAQQMEVDDDIYNDGTIFEGEIEESEILELTGYEKIEDFDEAMAEPYSTKPYYKCYGEEEKGSVADAIIENHIHEYDANCPNYDFNKSLDGAVLIFWSWERYVGYARKCIEIRYAYSNEKEDILTKRDQTFVAQCDVLLTSEEVAASDNIKESIREALDSRAHWKWTNPNFVEFLIDKF